MIGNKILNELAHPFKYYSDYILKHNDLNFEYRFNNPEHLKRFLNLSESSHNWVIPQRLIDKGFELCKC